MSLGGSSVEAVMGSRGPPMTPEMLGRGGEWGGGVVPPAGITTQL